MFNNSNKTTKHSVNKCSVLFNKFRKCLVRTASIITCTAIVATSVTPAFAAGITSGTTAASSYQGDSGGDNRKKISFAPSIPASNGRIPRSMRI